MDFMKKITNKEWAGAVEWASKSSNDFNKLKTEYFPRSFAELIDTYPEAKSAAKRGAKAHIKRITDDISSLSDFRDIWTIDIQKMHFSHQPGMIAYLDDYISRLKENYEKDLKKYYYQLEYLHNLGKPVEEVKSDPITPERIARARAILISELISVKRGQAICIFHDDHKPSMKLYPDNHVFCFSCQRRADAIDIFMELNRCGFQEAVRKLAP